jgi:hypothetical protein
MQLRSAVLVLIALAALAFPAIASADQNPASHPSAGAQARLAGVRDCHTWAYYPNVLISSVRNMRCKKAARDLRRHNAPIKRRFETPGGFWCTQQSGSEYGGQWRCVRGGKAYRFEFGE